MMYAIETKDLKKTYRTRIKGAGLRQSLQSLVKPQYKQVNAVAGVNLTVDQGEIMAFIGPNGAGKSTTIKMLCGILHPTEGQLSVLGLSPVKNRQQLAQRIGTVFGQKTQLWLHLPAVDSFTLLAAIYDVDEQTKKKRVDELVDRFGLSSFLHTPVRKLSLGQRIRCEVAASLLHDPDILFLDEPTIGLDVVVKQAIRELILSRNKEKGTTVFLTSHDPSDIEHLCRRAVVIDKGQVVLDTPVEALKQTYLRRKNIQVQFQNPTQLPTLPGVVSEWNPNELKAVLTVDTSVCDVGNVMEKISRLGGIQDITINDPPMEEIIVSIFQEKGAGG